MEARTERLLAQMAEDHAEDARQNRTLAGVYKLLEEHFREDDQRFKRFDRWKTEQEIARARAEGIEEGTGRRHVVSDSIPPWLTGRSARTILKIVGPILIALGGWIAGRLQETPVRGSDVTTTAPSPAR